MTSCAMTFCKYSHDPDSDIDEDHDYPPIFIQMCPNNHHLCQRCFGDIISNFIEHAFVFDPLKQNKPQITCLICRSSYMTDVYFTFLKASTKTFYNKK